jgi:site-specific recombinase XerD
MKIMLFHYKAKINSLGECPVYCRITINGKRSQFSTGIFCSNFGNGLVLGDLAQSQNMILMEVKKKITEIYTQKYLKGIDVTAEQLLHLYRAKTQKRTVSVSELMDIYRSHVTISDKITKATKRTYGHRIEVLEKYLIEIKKLNVNPNQLKKQDMAHFYNHLRERCNYTHEYTMKCLLMLKQVINHAINNNLIDSCEITKYPIRYIKPKEINALNITELKTLETHSFWSDRLAKIRDLFLFQVYTGMAFVDMCNFSKELIRKGVNNRTYIFYSRQKTGESAIIPFTPKIQHLLELYNYELPLVSLEKYNAYLKEVAEKCKINKRITSQVGRISCGMIYLNDGVSISAVSKILGHSNIGTTQRWYARANEFVIGNEFERVYNIVREPEVFYGLG